VLGLFAEQLLAVFLRDLVVIGVDFAEREEAVAIAAIFDERRLQRRFNAGNLGEIDIALELLVLGGLEVKFLDAVSIEDGDPGFFPVPRVDQHTRGHVLYSGRRSAVRAGQAPAGWTRGRRILWKALGAMSRRRAESGETKKYCVCWHEAGRKSRSR